MSQKTNDMHRTIRLIVIFVLLAGGGAICAWLIRTKPIPQKREQINRALAVAVIPIHPALDRTPILAQGTVRAKTQVAIIPQVSGKLTQVHPDLARGKIIPKGELLFEIDSTIYESRVRQREAEVRGLEAALDRHDQEQANLEERTGNARELLEIDKDDFETSMNLFNVDKVGTRRDVDAAHRKYLHQQGVLIELASRQAMIPHLKRETEAKLDAARARSKQRRHDLDNTKILCPFEARVEAVGAHESQVVTAHFSIGTLTDMEAFEISVGIDPRELRWLDETVRPEALADGEETSETTVVVRWTLHGQDWTWKGRVTRFERVDEATRTAQMVVEVRQADMVATLHGGGGIPQRLSIGMFCTTELPSEPLLDALLVPRHAIHDNRWVYVFEPDADSDDGRTGRLGRREVPMLRSLRGAVLVDYRDRDWGEVCELSPGDRVVVSPLVRPVVGMAVRVRDTAVAALPNTMGDEVELNTGARAPGLPPVSQRTPVTVATITVPQLGGS